MRASLLALAKSIIDALGNFFIVSLQLQIVLQYSQTNPRNERINVNV